MDTTRRHRRSRGGALLTLLCSLALLAPPGASAAPGDPLYVFSPVPPTEKHFLPEPPPSGPLNAPCGLTVDSAGNFWLSDHYHRAVDVFSRDTGSVPPWESYERQPLAAFGLPNPHTRPYDDPCGLALDSAGPLYVNHYHRNVARFPAPTSAGTGTVLAGSEEATGVGVNPSTSHAFANVRDHVREYDSSGAFVQDIGAASLEDGYGIAVSGFSATEGFLYVPDAASNTVKVYDLVTDTDDPVATITGPPGGFTSLVDSSVAVDNSTGAVYVLDNTQPSRTEGPRGRVQIFSSAGAYLGHLKYDVIGGSPSGLAVDNSGTSTQGRVYVTTGNSHQAGVYAYGPNAATSSTPQAPKFHPLLLGSPLLFPTVSIGGPGGASPICEADACPVLPPEPVAPTLTTLLSGHGNPKPRYARYNRRQGAKKKHRNRRRKSSRGARASMSASSSATFPAAANTPGLVDFAPSSSVASARGASSALVGPSGASAPVGSSVSIPTASSILLPGTPGFDAAAWADGGAPATQAGSHPYELELSLGLDQSGAGQELRSARLTLPPGLLLNPANGFGVLCSDSAFATPRSTPFSAPVESGESCPDQAQVGTVEVSTGLGGGQTKTFGLYNRDPDAGMAAKLGASPFGHPLDFEVMIEADRPGANMALVASEVPEALELQGVKITLWGVPWDASHNTERGDCLNEAEPDFALGKCSAGEPLTTQPRAFLTMPSVCGSALAFEATASSWQGGSESATAESAAPIGGCANLAFNLEQEGLLSVKKASSGSGYVYRFSNDDQSQVDPRGQIQALAKKVTVALPSGVTLNPSVGAGLGTCSPAQLAAESASSPPGQGCPNASKIGVFQVTLPYFKNALRGAIYLATPYDNPFDSLLAVYLVAKSADRGLLFRIPGKLDPDGEGTLPATFDDLPQLPYTDLEVNFRSGQRAPLISPPRCGAAISTLTLSPWASGVKDKVLTTSSPIESGVDAGPCPSAGIPPFAPTP
jgi:hypothetical protein